jgi:hypothetical protein
MVNSVDPLSSIGRLLHRTRQVVVVFASFCVFVVG